MPSKRVFYRTVFTVTVLSDDPLENMSLEDLASEIDDGPCVGSFTRQDSVPVDARTTVSMLEDMGCDSSFFQLTSEGEDAEE